MGEKGPILTLASRTVIEEFLRSRAREVAERTVERLSHTMALEDQRVSKKRERGRQVDELADELVWTLGKELWAKP